MTEEQARRAFWQIDNCVVVQGTPREAAAATAACVVVLLPICTAISRPLLMELLDQITSGDDTTSVALQHAIFVEVIKAYASYVSLVQHGSDVERSISVDLLLYCARYDSGLRERTELYIERASEDDTTPDNVRIYAASRLKFEKETW